MNVFCESFRDRLPLYRKDSLPVGDRRECREHLASCDECRDHVAGVEPSLLFARIRPEEVSAEDVARVLSGVRAGIALAQTQRRVDGVRRRGRRRVAAMTSAAALAAMTLVLPGSGRRPEEPVPIAPMAAAPSPGFAPAGGKTPSGTFPEDATIYDWNPGAADEEPRVVWIVDRSLDI